MRLPFENIKFTSLFIASVVVVLLEILSQIGFPIPYPYSCLFYLLITIYYGYPVIVGALKSLSKFKIGNIKVLMLLAVIGAFYLQEFSEAAVVMVLYMLGESLEDIGIDNSKSALEKLVNNAPRNATVKGVELPVNIDKIVVGSILEIKPGAIIPLDGIIEQGNSSVDEAAITGESVPKYKTKGDRVYAGTFNQEGYIEIKTTVKSEDTTFSKIVKLTFQATANKSERQKFIQKFATYYTPAILLLSVVLFFFLSFVLHNEIGASLKQAISILVIGCPCALVISTPVCIYAAIGNASSKGAIIKGGKFLEALSEVETVAMDKTRTITYGKPIVSDIIPVNDTDIEELLACTAGVEIYSEHPVAQAIVTAADSEGFVPHAVQNFKNIVGKGATAECLVCKDEVIRAGTLEFIAEKEAITDDERSTVRRLLEEGKTSVVVSFGKGVAGILGLTDEIKPDSAVAIDTLNKMHIDTIILSGDSQQAVDYIAHKAKVTRAVGGLLPEGKVEVIDSLKNVAMVGDGINDTPALAASMVGIAMGVAGSDIAIETADIALMNDRLSLIPFLIRLGRKTVRQIRFNTIGAITIKVLVIILSFLGINNLVYAIIADVGVMLVVLLLSLRLRKFA